MDELRGRVAVVTGGGSGIGQALAERAGAEGMTVVLLDIDADAAEAARESLAASGVPAHAFAVDVSDRDATLDVAERIARTVGDVWLLFNNAGVFLAAPLLEMPVEQCRFMVDVNLWGVVHGVQAFMPGMVARDGGHVVNTSSVEGLVTVRNAAMYNAAKHAVIGLSETLFRELEAAGSNVGVSVLCPGAVATGILNSARHWPDRLGPAPAVEDAEYPQLDELMAPAQAAQITFDGIAKGRFWILTHPDQYAPAMVARIEGAVRGENPNDETVDPNFREISGRVPQ